MMNPNVLKQKQDVVDKFVSRAKSSKAVIVVEYRGLTVSKLDQLRRNLRSSSSSFAVLKNKLISRATDVLGYDELKKLLTGPNGFVFSDDSTLGPKVVHKFARENEKFIIKGGVVDGLYVTPAELKVIATLPSREVLLSRLAGVFKAPFGRLAFLLRTVSAQKVAANS
jgi:large subunit ribosomal protein L10